MIFTKAILALACLIPGTLVAQAAKVTPLFSKDLTNRPGKEGLMVTVEYPPNPMPTLSANIGAGHRMVAINWPS